MTTEEIVAYDKRHIWHPYTSATNPLPCYPVKRASGVRIELENGDQLIEAMSSWWCMLHGYNHPEMNKAMKSQIDQMAHVMFGGLTHSPSVELTKKLLSMVSSNLTRVFYADSGSVSVEVAMKMALQYAYSKGQADKNKFLTFKRGYHGDTWNAMSVCDPQTGMHHIFGNYLPQHIFMPEPQIAFGDTWNESARLELASYFEDAHHQVAAVIVEPIVQGAGGMRMYHANYLRVLRELCDQYGIPLILDEIATGFGRTGKLFAYEHAGVQADIMCLGKALTGGYISFSATLCSDEIAEQISSVKPGVFMHGPTFMGNPLACATALKSIDLLEKMDWKTNVDRIEEQLTEGLSALRQEKKVKDVRVLGAIGVVEMHEAIDVARVQKAFVAEGVWVRPFLNLIYVMPPFIMALSELTIVINAIQKIIKNEC